MEKNFIIIQKILEEFMQKMGFAVQVEVKKSPNSDSEALICNIISSEDSNLIIGQHGNNLQSIQHISRLLVRKKISEKINFTVDVNSYREQKNQSIIEHAKLMAEQALNEKRAIVLRPMNAYERRLIHIELSKNKQITTESIGEEENRKVVIKPINLI